MRRINWVVCTRLANPTMGTIDDSKYAGRRFCTYLALLTMCAVSNWALGAETSSNNGPSISKCKIGFDNYYKLGFWTAVHVELAGIDDDNAKRFHLDITAADSDGISTTVSSPVSEFGGHSKSRTVEVYTQIGRVSAPIRAALYDGTTVVDSVTLLPGEPLKSEESPHPLAATSELAVSVGASTSGLPEAVPDRSSSGGLVGRKLVQINDINSLPTESCGYDAVDVLVISTSDPSLCHAFAADERRLSALDHWVKLGGHLLLLCGGQNAKSMIGPGGPLEKFAPGKLASVIALPDTGPVEHYASSTAIGSGSVEVPQLTNVEGIIEAYAGTHPADLPLVVRSPYGFGEIAFAGLDFSRPPLSKWPGRIAFLHALLRPYLADSNPSTATQTLVASGFNDMSGALRQQLGHKFKFVAPISFALVSFLAVAYLVFLGPFDFLLIHQWMRKPWFAWITFPLLIAIFASASLVVANWSRGPAGVRLNQLELIDVDEIDSLTRGNFWANVYSPNAELFNLRVRLPSFITKADKFEDALLSWWGLPGIGIGGMQTTGSDLGLVHDGYSYGSDKQSLSDMPILTSASKALLARWNARSALAIDTHLADADGLIAGTVKNQTGEILQNVRLLYGSWAYRLGTMKPGDQVEVGEQLSPRRVKTLVTREALEDSSTADKPAESRVFAAEKASAKQVLSLMMFYEAAGGIGFAHVPNRYQAYCDMSRQLELGRAVLVADGTTTGSQLMDDKTSEEIGSEKLNTSALVFRFLLPVAHPTP